ncbi:hypothetical protein ABE042_04860 [Viridibacillus arvi]|uniref:hypothetical protein n=1 Tax=Viridibacillus arvi TaxID=263475 RepID=UPI003D2A2563
MSYFSKSLNLTILDLIIIGAIGGIVGSAILSFLVFLFKKFIEPFVSHNKARYKNRSEYRKRLKSGNINVTDIFILEKKAQDGLLNGLEKVAWYRFLKLKEEREKMKPDY